jgi:very-short-patch-repair endonuclease
VRLERVLERQAGVVTLAQALACGVCADVVQRRAAAGAWTRLYPAVYLAGGHRVTDEARVWAAWLWAGDDTVVSGRSAAFWHRLLPDLGARVEVTVAQRRKPRAQPGVRVRRRDLPTADTVRFRGLRTTGVPLTVLETTVALPDGSAFLDRALQRHVRLDELEQAYRRNAGARGWPAARRLLDAAAPGAESTAERLLVTLLSRAGVRGWTLGYPFGRWRIDLAFPAAMVAVEVDGWAWHQDVDRFRTDRTKQNALVRAGWLPLRFTWHDLTRRPQAVLAEIRAAVARVA